MNQEIENFLQRSDKGEVLEWLQENLETSVKGLFVLATPEGDGLQLHVRQFGNSFAYEVQGFADWASASIADGWLNHDNKDKDSE